MSVRDDILNQKAQKGTKAWSEEHDTQNDYTQKAQKGTLQYVDSTAASNPAKEETVEATSKPTDTADNKKTLSFKELYEILNPKPDPEQLKKDAKRARTRNIIAALGDGISAIANLHFTTKGAPNMYDGKSTLSEKSQARYDKLMQDYKDNLDKYRLGQLKAEELDREWNHMTEREKVADEHNDRMYQLGVDKFEHEKSQDVQTQTNWQNTFDENKRQFDENLKLNMEKYKAQLEADEIDKEYKTFIMNGGKKAGDNNKRSAFVADKGKEISIHNDVWKNAVPQLFDIMIKEGLNPFPGANSTMMAMKIANMKADDKEDFVRGHWHESQGAADLMMYMSTIDPYNMESRFEEKFNVDEDNTMPGVSNNDSDNTMPGVKK